MATIQDVARRAGVSVATVSRVINDQGNVRQDTVELVRQAIEDLGYHPNSMGRNLRQNRSNRILVLQPSIANPFYPNVIRGIDATASAAGYQMILSDTNNDPEREGRYLSLLDGHVVDGAIITTPCHEPEHYRAIAGRYPMVFCSEDYADSPVASVTMDNRQGGYDAARYLIGLGHRKIGFMCVYGDHHTVHQRLRGFRDALGEAGIPLPERYIVAATSPSAAQMPEITRQAALKFAELADRPTAIFCTSDLIAIAAMHALKEAGLRVPEDISVCGIDNIDFSNLCDPPLTTVAVPLFDMGCQAVRLLLKRFADPGLPARRHVVPHTIIERQSTAPLDV